MEVKAMRSKDWNRKTINAFWYIVIIQFAAQGLGLSLTDFRDAAHFYHDLTYYTIIPTATLIALVGITEYIWRRYSNIDYWIIIIGICIPAVLIFTFSSMNGIQNLLFISILLSAYYYERRKVIFSAVMTVIAFCLIFLTNSQLNQTLVAYDILLTLGIFASCTVLSLGIMARGLSLVSHLQQSIHEREQLITQNVLIEYASKIDALTGLYNHKTFHEYLDRLIEQHERGLVSLDLVIVDLDNFKLVNDTYGHWAGDILLKEVASVIQQHIGSNNLAFRQGGEEFAILFIDQAWEDVLRITEGVRIDISRLDLPELKGHHVSASMGISRLGTRYRKSEWYQRADDCLYQAKRTGKNKIVTDHIAQ